MTTNKSAGVDGNIAQLRIRIAQLMGADVDNVLKCLDISMEELESPDLYLDAEFNNRVWQVLEQQTGDELVGASMSAYFQLASMGLVGKAIMACDTIHQGLASYERYSKLLPLRDQVEMIERDQQLVFQLTLLHPLLSHTHHSICSFFGFVLKSLEQLSGQKIPVKQLGFVFDAPKSSKTLVRYQEIFGSDSILFSQQKNWFSLDDRYKDVQNLASNKLEFELIDRKILGLMLPDETEGSDDFCLSVEDYIRKNLGHAEVSLTKLSKDFAMSERKLQNELSRRQQSYSKLLSKVRKDLVVELISGQNLSVNDMAYQLGYKDINSLSRHFKKWFGVSVSEYRKRSL